MLLILYKEQLLNMFKPIYYSFYAFFIITTQKHNYHCTYDILMIAQFSRQNYNILVNIVKNVLVATGAHVNLSVYYDHAFSDLKSIDTLITGFVNYR